jgi:hypothetical protein
MICVSKEDAQRTKHVKGCAGYEDCQCFGRYISNKDLYALQKVLVFAIAVVIQKNTSKANKEAILGHLENAVRELPKYI